MSNTNQLTKVLCQSFEVTGKLSSDAGWLINTTGMEIQKENQEKKGKEEEINR
jgi:hypothetical protein